VGADLAVPANKGLIKQLTTQGSQSRSSGPDRTIRRSSTSLLEELTDR